MRLIAIAALMVCWMQLALAQPDAPAASTDANAPHMLDRVVAVVNNQVILASDIDFELRVFRLLPIGRRGDFTRAKALERLTTRALIEQQIVQQDPHGMDVLPKDVEDSLAELRESLPACRHRECVSAAGWASYLATLGLTPDRVSEYWSRRMAVLRFIEMRFRSGIRVAPEEIQKYYREELIPKYASPADAPPLDKVSARIQEVLLQQRVNGMLNDWLKSLQDQGQVEILDPALRTPAKTEPSDNETAPAAGDSPQKEGGA